MENTQQRLTPGVLAVASVPSLILLAAVVLTPLMPASVSLSFLAVDLVVTYQFLISLRLPVLSAADSSVLTFNMLFMFIAPVVQYCYEGRHLVNTVYATDDVIVFTNLVSALFILSYALTNFFRKMPPVVLKPWPTLDRGAALRLTALLVVFLAVAAFSILYNQAQSADLGEFETPSITPADLVLKKFLFFVPAAALLSLCYVRGKVDPQGKMYRGRWVAILLTLAVIETIVTQNPLTEKRNSLGPVYLALGFILFEPFLQTRIRQVVVCVGLVALMLPLVSVFTHYKITEWGNENVDAKIFLDNFLSIHYDAWTNLYASIEMVSKEGLSYGRQLAGSLLFFVPSSVWTNKPQASGIMIGNYLIDHYAMWFTNLSSPLVAEAYLDFGVFGAALYGFVLAKVVQILDSLSRIDRNPACRAGAAFFSFYLVFLMRGPLMIAFAFGSGALLAFGAVYIVGFRIVPALRNSLTPQVSGSRLRTAIISGGGSKLGS